MIVAAILPAPPGAGPTLRTTPPPAGSRAGGSVSTLSLSLRSGGRVVETLLADQDLACQEAVRRDRERLQGNWRFVAGQREAQLTVHGDRFTMRFRNGDVYHGKLTVNPRHRPRAMDLHIEDGPAPFPGLTALAIYQFDGDHLIWCPSPPGQPERPRAFPHDDHGRLCLIFRREKKRRS
jgi:uncharacterized protein (TIGR03067 family)